MPAVSSSSSTKRKRPPHPMRDVDEGECEGEYFEAYGDLAVHRLMLRDEPRMEFFVRVFERLAPQIRGKRVLEVGTGTGVLSLLCWRICQPREILAVEATPETAELAEEIVARNPGAGDVITVVNSRVEDLNIAPNTFDVLISEWMGFYLLHEGMLDSVLYARDHFCKASDELVMVPECAEISCAAWYAEQFLTERVWSWGDYLGLDFSALGQRELASNTGTPIVDVFSAEELISDQQQLLAVNLKTVPADFFRKTGDIVRKNLSFSVNKANKYFTGVQFFWSVSNAVAQDQAVVLNTSPACSSTHWKQVGVLLGCCAPVQPGDVLDLQVALVRETELAREFSIDIQA